MKLRFSFFLFLLSLGVPVHAAPWTVPAENVPYGGWVPHTNMGVPSGIPSRSGGTVINVTASPYNAAGVITETTGTITSGSTSLVVADASSFAVGHSVRVGHKQVVDLVIDTGASSTGEVTVGYGTGTDTNFDRVVRIEVVSGDTAAQVATKFRASTLFNFEWVVSGSGTTVRFTRLVAIAFGSGFSVSGQGVTATPTVVTTGSVVASFTKITAIVGNTITIADAASASVTDAVVSHNDSTAINEAVSAASPGDIVYIPAGQYRMDGQIYVANKGITIRGDGPTSELHYLVYGNGIYAGYNTDLTANHTITAGLSAGSTTVTIDDTTDFTTGRMMRIEYANDSSVPVFQVAGYPYRQVQIVKITGKTSTTLSFSPAIYASFAGTGRVSGYQHTAEGFGAEDFQIYAYNQLQRVFWLERTAYSWVKNVKSNNGKNTHVDISESLGVEIRDSWFNTLGNGASPNAGAIILGNASNCLVENNILYKGFPLVEVNGSMGNAFLFNFLEDSSGQAFDDNHNAHSRFNLYEGNRAPGVTSDGYYGTGSHGTIYGNRLNARPSAASTAGYAVVLNRGARNYVFANNIVATGAGDSNYSFGNPNLGNGSSEGTADHNNGSAWGHLKLDGTTPFVGTITTRTSDSQITITLSGTGVTGDLTLPYFDAGNGNMRLWWNGYANSAQVRMGTVSSSTVFEVNTHGDATVLPASSTAVELWVGALGFQELDLGVDDSTTRINNWSAITSGIVSGETTADTFPDSIAYPSGAPSWWSGSWPAYGAANYAVRDDARIPAHTRYLGGGGGGGGDATLNANTVNVGRIIRAP